MEEFVAERAAFYKTRIAFPILSVHPSSIGIVASHRAGPELAQRLYLEHVLHEQPAAILA